jgi:hypothetical protein
VLLGSCSDSARIVATIQQPTPSAKESHHHVRRFTFRTNPKKIAEEFVLADVPVLEHRYNIAPTQQVAVVRLDPHARTRRLDMLRWGLVPFWADDPKIGNQMINARSESAADKPAFKHSFRAKRRLVAASGSPRVGAENRIWLDSFLATMGHT